VAVRFGLTKENCATHPSFYTIDRMTSDFEKNIQYFILENEGVHGGCVAVERATPDTCYLERLCVLPEKRRNRYGTALVERVFAEARSLGAKSISTGIIAGHTELKSWYSDIGFTEKDTREFEHLPFHVTFMVYTFSNYN